MEDAEGMVALLNPIIRAGCYTAITKEVDVAGQKEWVAGQVADAKAIFHVAVDETGRVVGMQDLEPFSPFAGSFDHVGVMGTFVAMDCHRRGIGAQLFQAMFAAAKAKGYEKLFAYVRADNEAGLRAYRGQGFEVIGTAKRHCKIGDKYIDEVMIEKFL